MHGSGKITAYSAGSRPSGRVNEKAIGLMREKGYDLSKHQSKPFGLIPQEDYEYVITMGCGETCPYFPARYKEDWGIPDPKNMPVEKFRQIRDLIEEKVKELIGKI